MPFPRPAGRKGHVEAQNSSFGRLGPPRAPPFERFWALFGVPRDCLFPLPVEEKAPKAMSLIYSIINSKCLLKLNRVLLMPPSLLGCAEVIDPPFLLGVGERSISRRSMNQKVIKTFSKNIVKRD